MRGGTAEKRKAPLPAVRDGRRRALAQFMRRGAAHPRCADAGLGHSDSQRTVCQISSPLFFCFSPGVLRPLRT